MSFFQFTLLLPLALLLSFCIQAPAQSPPHSNCTSLFSPSSSSWLSNNTPSSPLTLPLDDNTRNLTLFKQSSLSLLAHDTSLSFTFTTTYHDEGGVPPSLAFILVRSPQLAASPSSIKFMELIPFPCKLHVCNSFPDQIPTPTCSCDQHPYKFSDKTLFKDEVTLTYDADAADLQVQAVFYDDDGLKTSQTFNLSIYADDSIGSNENITLFVGCITSGEASINVTSHFSGVHQDDDNAKSNHIKVVVMWVIVGVSMMGILMGLLILVLFITKKRRGRPSLVNSRPAGHGAPPTSTSRAPFSHHDLESSPTPMMRALPLSPPYTDAFQNSGTASWLKQPNAR